MRWTMAFLGLLLSHAAFAGPVTWDYTGSVAVTDLQTVFGPAGSFWSDAGVSVGDRFAGSVTFDPDAAFAAATTFVLGGTAGTIIDATGTNPAFAAFGPLVISRAGTGLGDLIYDPARGSDALRRERTGLDTLLLAAVFPQTNGQPIDTFSIEVHDTLTAGVLGRSQFFRFIAQPPGSGAIPDDSFLSKPPDLADLLLALSSIQEIDSLGRASVMSGLLDSVSIRVSEPETLLLFVGGLVGIALSRRRRAA